MVSTSPFEASRYFMHGVCREGSQCLFSHDLANSKPSTICKYYQKGCCAYGTRCRQGLNAWAPEYVERGYDHTRPLAAAGGAVGPPPPIGPSAAFSGLHPPSVLTVAAMKTPSQESGRRDKRTLVLRDRNLSGLAEEKTPPGTALSNPGSCSNPQLGPEMKPHSYLDAIRSGLDDVEASSSYSSEQQLCPYAAAGECRFGDACVYLHGDMCDICRLQVLHPFDSEQRRAHEKVCMATFEVEMEKAFAFQASQDKVCSICMEVILEKASASERRFGILSSCNHTYCLSCIRQWRCAKQFENQIIKFGEWHGHCLRGPGKCASHSKLRDPPAIILILQRRKQEWSCPECRVISEFVIPSVYWVEDQNKKNELIEAFKQGMGKKACKYFEQGKGTCPFGSKCLYRHAYPDGRLAEPEKPRKQLSSEGTVRFFNSVRLWDFIENRETQQVPSTEDVDMTELGDLFMHLSGVDSSDP
ncbi:Putative E3 ubiquitin-protein ligase makorin-2 [Fukomys damarensis]|uniref:E3 ubiquitin-protein ligase makorin-2 n=1 Tax=Fukomys damarensis TaxID=885580 RepID=A0A091D8Q2_FUKDA|nr:Putative E3 ubiquitin-protein ligase makorin-2 [Fukomys damarensis]